MRTISLILGLLLFPTLAARAQDSALEATSAVQRVLQHQQDAWNRHDLEGFMAGYWNSPEPTFFSGVRITAGWQSTLDRYRKSTRAKAGRWGNWNFRI
jgi:hypothetical protein